MFTPLTYGQVIAQGGVQTSHDLHAMWESMQGITYVLNPMPMLWHVAKGSYKGFVKLEGDDGWQIREVIKVLNEIYIFPKPWFAS